MALSVAEVIVAPWFGAWFCGLFITWMILSFLFRHIPAFKAKPKATAHQFVVFVPFAFLALQGAHLWFFDPKFAAAFKHDRIYGGYQDSQNLVLMMFAFQIWDFVTTLVTKELCAAQHLAHHGLTSCLALMGLVNGPHGFLMYYAAFFFGVSEISSLFLTWVDFFRTNKALASEFPKTNEVMRVCFAVTFLILRCVYWPVVSVDFWMNAIKSDAPKPLLVCWLGANLCLTLLQYFWGFLIVKGIIKLLRGDKSDPREDAIEPSAREVSVQDVGGGNLLAAAPA